MSYALKFSLGLFSAFRACPNRRQVLSKSLCPVASIDFFLFWFCLLYTSPVIRPIHTQSQAVMNLFNRLQLTFATVSTNIQNFMGDMKAGVLMILQNMVNGAIDIINGFINVLNKIPGVSIDAIEKVTFRCV